MVNKQTFTTQNIAVKVREICDKDKEKMDNIELQNRENCGKNTGRKGQHLHKGNKHLLENRRVSSQI